MILIRGLLLVQFIFESNNIGIYFKIVLIHLVNEPHYFIAH